MSNIGKSDGKTIRETPPSSHQGVLNFVTKPNLAMKRSADSDDSGNEQSTNGAIKKIGFSLKKDLKESGPQKKKPLSNISIQLKSAVKASNSPQPAMKPKVGKAALAFNPDESDEDDEEMPPEAKMRMKNIGRETPTSSGPNSFGKSRMGFCDSKKMYERKLKDLEDQLVEK